MNQFILKVLCIFYSCTTLFGQDNVPYESIFSSGEIYKISTKESGLHKISKEFLETISSRSIDLGDLDQIRLFGFPAGALHQTNLNEIPHGVVEVSYDVVGIDDNSFDNDDYILFYANSTKRKTYNSSESHFEWEPNPFSSQNYFFIKFDNINRSTLEVNSNEAFDNEYMVTESKSSYYLGEESINLLGQNNGTYGSGQQWFDKPLLPNNVKNPIDLPITPKIGDSLYFELGIAFRGSEQSNGTLNMYGNEIPLQFKSSRLSDPDARFADYLNINDWVIVNNIEQMPSITIEGTLNSMAWLDYLQVDYIKPLLFQNDPLLVFDENPEERVKEFNVINESRSNDISIWDITNPLKPSIIIEGKRNEIIPFNTNKENSSYLIFRKNNENIPGVEYIERTEPQNILDHNNPEYMIVYHPLFIDQANKLSQHRQSYSGVQTFLVNIEEIYNEFAGGRKDPTALRNYIRLVHQESDQLHSILLFGDASYDYQGKNSSIPYHNFVPTFQTKESLSPLSAFPTDDYFVLLDEGEGSQLKGALDLSLGRLPVSTAEEADVLVDKIISYDIDESKKGKWQLKTMFIADDEDNNIHLNQTERIINRLEEASLEINKVYLDAFEQVSTPGQARYPQVNEKINKQIQDGVLIVNYFGHGGQRGWAQERILTNADILSWNNKYNPLLITATCSFAAFDNPELFSPGEQVLLNENGAIALLSTVRSVYSSQNFRLTQSVFDTIFTRVDNEYMTIGEAFKRAKNTNAADTLNPNSRKFMLLGDPMTKLKLPELMVSITKLNGEDIGQDIDTLGALERFVIEGEVQNNDSLIQDQFFGNLQISLFDKPRQLRTLANDPTSYAKDFSSLSSELAFREVEVKNGKFTAEFIIPKDIDYQIGQGTLFLYAENEVAQAKGSFNQFKIGGISDKSIDDNIAPEVTLYLNNRNSSTSPVVGIDPILIADITDNVAINYSGSSVGHDMLVQIDNDPNKIYVVNDFFTPDQNDSGWVAFPMKDLEPGNHSAEFTVFDIANNVSKSSISFEISNDESVYINELQVSPNPVATTTDIEVYYASPNSPLEVEYVLYDINGQEVLRLFEQKNSDSTGYLTTSLDMSSLPAGVYLLQIKINSGKLNNLIKSSFERIVKMN